MPNAVDSYLVLCNEPALTLHHIILKGASELLAIRKL